MIDLLLEMATESWLVLQQMSPYLLLGFGVAGLLSVFVSPRLVESHLGGGRWSAILKAALFGVPLPLCSCGVIPVSASLRRAGASRAATTSFLLSTPQTGVDSIAVTWALLGPVFAVFRPIAALVTGLVGGGLVQLLDRRDEETEAAERGAAASEPAEDRQGAALGRALRYGFRTLPRDIGLALLLGIAIAGAMSALVPQDELSPYMGGGLASILILMAAGVPVYVCATASVPIAAGFLHMGASPGAALAFLIAGPATNAAAFTTIWKLLGRKSAILYLATVAIGAVAAGLLLNALIPAVEAAAPGLGHDHGAMGVSWLHAASAIVLLGALLFSFVPSAPRAERGEGESAVPAGSERLELRVEGMNCSHCTESVRRALTERPEVSSAQVDLAAGRATVVGRNLDPQKLVGAVAELGFTASADESANAS